MKYKTLDNWLILLSLAMLSACSKKSTGSNTGAPVVPVVEQLVSTQVAFWLTKGDRSVLFSKQNVGLNFGTAANVEATITVDTTQRYQTMDGFGFTLTGGSAIVLNSLGTAARDVLLQELFSPESNGIGISYLRVSIGASDLNPFVYSYNDLPAGATDITLQQFSLNPDRNHVIPVLKKIVQIYPSIKILASPWSAPVWMKTNGSTKGGRLQPQYYGVYANYFIKYIHGMAAEGIPIDAITIQNEPLNPHNNPSMEMSAAEQADFIKNHLGPKFAAEGIRTKIITYDHNADVPAYPLEILNDPAAKAYVDGSAFHLYGGSIDALSQVHHAHPDRHIYFTEQNTASSGNFGGDLGWHMKNLVVGAPRNWSRNVLEWNLANDPSFGPHTDGGCNVCLGALTIGNGITRNVAYYIIAHASKFVRPGSVRVASNVVAGLPNVAYVTPEGKKVLIVYNEGTGLRSFNIHFRDKWVTASLDGGAAGTFIWQ